jgi:hypothetical protein
MDWRNMALIVKTQMVTFDSVYEPNDILIGRTIEKEKGMEAAGWGVYVPDEFVIMLYWDETTK